METIKLIKPTIEYAEDIMRFRQEILETDDEDSFAGCGVLRKCKSEEEWIRAVIQCEENPPQGFATSTTYIAVRSSDNKVVGIIDLRHHINNPVLGAWGGHIGYTVRPSRAIGKILQVKKRL